VAIRIEHQDGALRITVVDDGIGGGGPRPRPCPGGPGGGARSIARGPWVGNPTRRAANARLRGGAACALARETFCSWEGSPRLLQAHDIDVVAAVGSGTELLDELLAQRPDVAVIDVRLPPTFTDEGLRVALEARKQLPGLPVLVLSQYVEQLYARELLSDQAGGVGYLLQDRGFSHQAFVD